jgi:hypothetical protein
MSFRKGKLTFFPDFFLFFGFCFFLLVFSPLLEHLNLPPKDLWPNSATFHKQIAERNAKLKTNT